ncbi:DUF896 domain-containing protein [Paenibacillus hemerocallicola]|jgi:uncharacterized protein YnzC (UPF0291/DUF896 family)|uniref:UPF0291 protein FE784_00320 n=1 Tax=Paenibacillus hemerocallicola TaxID=1172614 RepID=A0A5C4TGQ3_9BACL|nr:DUF896 domain-containing protein [Paenibacillus hemerocallicola]TNJ68145.1 DUF896 domain-containing protein [Paenibacillus hemerocallicola]
MITEQMIARINELAKKANTVGLTDEELEERNELRKRYIEAFKTSLRAQLDSIEFVDEDGKDSSDKKLH